MALSGGADSAAVLKLAVDFMGRENVKAVTCSNTHVFNYEIENARKIAATLGVSWHSFEVNLPKQFFENGDRRCYYCKNAILSWIEFFRYDQNIDVILDGSNTDDLNEDRPGFKAVEKHGVRSPLLETGRGKAYAHEIVKFFEKKQIFFIDESCAATRIMEQPITSELLRQIERIEDKLREQFPSIRVKHYPKKTLVTFKDNTPLDKEQKSYIENVINEYQKGIDIIFKN